RDCSNLKTEMDLSVILLCLGLRTLCAQSKSISIDKAHVMVHPTGPVVNGNNLTLTCVADITTSGTFDFRREFTFFKDDEIIYNVTSHKDKETLDLSPARVSKSGDYACEVSAMNKIGRSPKKSIEVTGLSKPNLHISKDSAHQGDKISVTCEAPEEEPPFVFIFYKRQNQTTQERRTRQTNNKSFTVTFIIEEKGILQFECKVILMGVSQVTSEPSEKKMVSVAELFTTPRMDVSPSPTFTEGKNMTVQCSIQTSPFTSDQVEILIQKDKHILASSKTGSVTYSQIATERQTGIYTCKAELGETSKSRSLQVTVTELFPRPLLLSNIPNTMMNYGDGLSINCSVPWMPPNVTNDLVFYLIKDKAKIPLRTGEKFTKSVTEGDSGSYTCEVTISNITKTSYRKFIKVYVSVSTPVLTHRNKSSGMVVLGSTLELKCKSEKGTLPITYSIFRGNELLDTREEMMENKAIFKLIITKEKDSGEYHCQTRNRNTGLPQNSNIVNITIISPIREVELTVIPQSASVEEGKELSLVCAVKNGSLPIDFQFFAKRGSEILLHSYTANKKFHTEMQIMSFSSQNDGVYFCRATNSALQAVDSNSVQVKAVLATWKKWIIVTFVVFILVAAAAICVYFYLERKKKGIRFPIFFFCVRESQVLGASVRYIH
ncbi:hypothetical protein GDO86_013804, partial [Hymenochirus boettgeri]